MQLILPGCSYKHGRGQGRHLYMHGKGQMMSPREKDAQKKGMGRGTDEFLEAYYGPQCRVSLYNFLLYSFQMETNSGWVRESLSHGHMPSR